MTKCFEHKKKFEYYLFKTKSLKQLKILFKITNMIDHIR